jgi:energy-coupling factor transporter ATP-binding protein EcfA2
MKTQQVHIKQFKCLKDLNVDVQGKNVILCGDNGVGKSSFLQFIQIALGAKKIPPSTEAEGYVIVLKDGREIKFNVKKGKIVMEAPGGIIESKKGVIAGIVGATSLNIDEFVKLSESESGRKKQVEIFKSMLPEEIQRELANYEGQIAKKYEERTEVGRNLKMFEGSLKKHESYNLLIGGEKPEKIDIKAKEEQLAKAVQNNETYTRGEITCSQKKEGLKSIETEIYELEERLKSLKSSKETLQVEIDKIDTWLKSHSKIDVSQLQSEISNAHESNRKVDSYYQAVELEKTFKEHEKSYEVLTTDIEELRVTVKDTIESMDTPVNGLFFNTEGLVYNGTPVHIDSMSTSEIIELGIKLKMAENPELGMLFIEHGESIGQKRYEDIMKIAKDNDWQIFIEQVVRGQEKLQVEFIVE